MMPFHLLTRLLPTVIIAVGSILFKPGTIQFAQASHHS
jgi:hypothetical protein